MNGIVVCILALVAAPVYSGGCSGCNGHAGCIFKDSDGGFGCGETPTAPTVYQDLSYTMGIIKGDTECDPAAAYFNATVYCDDRVYKFAFTQFSDGNDVSVSVPGTYNCASKFRMETLVTNFEHGYTGCLLDLGSNAPSWNTIDAATGKVSSTSAVKQVKGYRKAESLQKMKSQAPHVQFEKTQHVLNPLVQGSGGCSGCNGHAGCIFKDSDGGFGCGETPTAATVYKDLSYTMGIIKGDTECDPAAAYFNATVYCDDSVYKFAFTQFNDGDNVSVSVPGAYNCASKFRMETLVTNFEHGYTGCLLDLGSNAPSWTSIDATTGKVSSTNGMGKLMGYRKDQAQHKMEFQASQENSAKHGIVVLL